MRKDQTHPSPENHGRYTSESPIYRLQLASPAELGEPDVVGHGVWQRHRTD